MFYYFPLPDYHSNCSHLYYKTVKLTKFSSAVNRADLYDFKVFYKDYFCHNKGCFTEILIKKEQNNIEFLAFYWTLVFSSPAFDR